VKFSVNFERDDHGEWTATMTECPRLVRHGFTIGTAAQKLFESWLIGALRETKPQRAAGATPPPPTT